MNAVATPDSILDPQRHARLLDDIERSAKTANIPVRAIHHSAKPYLSAAELDWMKHFHAHRENGSAGLLLTGAMEPTVEMKMQAMVGALIRNFMDARLMGMHSVFQAAKEGNMPEPTVLAVPNLFVRSAEKNFPDWKIQTVYDVLLQRLTAGKPSILYVENMVDLRNAYGAVFHSHLLNNYLQLDKQ